MKTENLFDELPADGTAGEAFTTLVNAAGFRLVRIVSTGQATPEGEWYDQDEAEWVAVIRGRAGLLIEGEGEARILNSGGYVLIPAHVRHRVEWTDPDQPTIWLALHFGEPRPATSSSSRR
jgi:cupin 2 domain-containing protein